MSKFRTALLSLTLLGLLGFAGSAAAVSEVVLTFDDDMALGLDFTHGTVVNTQYLDAYGVEILATNIGGGPGIAAAFDSLESGTLDDDLEMGSGWSGGNLPSDTVLADLLIVQENGTGCGDGVCDFPDDEGSRPAATLVFRFLDDPVITFGFDLIDVEAMEEGSVTFYSGSNSVIVPMVDFLMPSQLGNNFANRVSPFEAGMGDLADLSEFDRVDVNLGGSGAVDNVRFMPVPEPSTLGLLALGLVGLGSAGRRR